MQIPPASAKTPRGHASHLGSEGFQAHARQALQDAPPRWIFVQEYNESDINHADRLDFESQPAWKPIFDFITANYELVSSEDGVDAYRLK